MSQNHHDESRRRFLRAGLLGAAAVPLSTLMVGRKAHAQSDMPKLAEDDPAAQALSYTHDYTTTDNPAHQEGAHCANCQLYTGDPNADWGPCSAFPGKRVNTQGWCSAWVKKA
ncbi:hypothetical protein KBTX_02683 [wastewater metagenome]|uniref:High potential iron-sulfur proteins family profile domain-containing protein n=2 Tax=unclassified sequences TaxID=12908 RepID=A0A5B8RCI2_9ZZZZ|nr:MULTISPECIES: high-potential iron-sulfur protein [Arhodomonas]MCS4503439.1 high-potential iron-sulfur protein [Arhodomonas aquaeolei]QEA06351.1 hypothetical protein KBTEX_02683 [uncultured organism]